MSNLWTTAFGQAAVREATYHAIRHRMSRHFPRNFMIAFDNWITSGKTEFDFETVIGDLNVLNDPEITNLYELLLQLGLLPTTWQDTDFYVNNTTGSDVNGVGTSASPFATVEHVLNFLRNSNTRIEHDVHILVEHTGGAAQTVIVEDYWDVPTNVGKGSINILGVGSPVETKADQVLTGVNALAGAGEEFVVGGAPWVADDWIGEWIQVQDGPQKDWVYPAQSNTTNQVYFAHYSTLPAIGNSVRGIRPPIRFVLNSLNISGDFPKQQSGNKGAGIYLANMELDFSSSTFDQSWVQISNHHAGLTIDFVTFIFKDAGYYDVISNDATINFYAPRSLNAAAKTNTGFINLGDTIDKCGMNSRRVTKAHGTLPMLESQNSLIYRWTSPDMISSAFGQSDFTNFAVNGYYGSPRKTAGTNFYYLLLSNKNCAQAMEIDGTSAYFYHFYMMNGTKGIVARRCQIGFASNVECDPALPNFAVYAGENTFISTEGALANFVGVGGAISFTAPNPDVSFLGWPIAGALVGDDLGSVGIHSAWVAREG